MIRKALEKEIDEYKKRWEELAFKELNKNSIFGEKFFPIRMIDFKNDS